MPDKHSFSVLVIDDEPLSIMMIKELLGRAGYTVHSSTDGQQGIEKARKLQPNLILLDLIMPRIDGFRTCRELKSDPLTRDIPIIFLTALADDQSKRQAFDAGGVDYLVKPVNHQDLKHRVTTHVRLGYMHDQLAQQNTRLQQSEKMFRAIFNSASVGMALLNTDGGFMRANISLENMTGYSRQELELMTLLTLNHPDHVSETRVEMQQIVDDANDIVQSSTSEPKKEGITRFLRKDGSSFWAEHGLSPLNDDHGNLLAIISVITDLTEHKKAQKEAQLAATVFDTAGEAIFVTDAQNRILSVNPSFSRITGYLESDIQGKKPNILSSGQHDPAFYQKMWDQLGQNDRWQGEIWNCRKGGEVYPQHLSISTVRNSEGEVTNYVAVGVDITSQKKLEELLRKQAHIDPLTKLPNRALFKDRLNIALHHAERNRRKLAVLYIDLDEFKPINDTFGHEEGDKVLINITAILNQCVRDEDTVARLGGDEFTIILNDLELESQAHVVTERILENSCTTVEKDDQQLPLSLSIGIAFYPRHATDGDALINIADEAMYRAKKSGKNTWAEI